MEASVKSPPEGWVGRGRGGNDLVFETAGNRKTEGTRFPSDWRDGERISRQ